MTHIRAFTSALSTVTGFNLFLLCNWCSESSRGFPDVAAQAIDLIMIKKEDMFVSSGTSISAPVRLFLLPCLCAVRPRALS